MNARGLRRDALLGAAGLIALACYLLACGPAFSPDDSQVLYPSNDPASGYTVMALYDRRTRTTRALMTLPVGSDDSLSAYAWTPDGREALALWSDADDVLHVAAVPPRGGTPRQLSIDAVAGDAVLDGAWHPAVLGHHVYLAGHHHLWRIDLRDGTTQSLAVAGRPRLAAAGGRLYYRRDLDVPPDTAPRVEVGRVDPGTLAMTPQFTAVGAGNDVFAVSDDGARVALDAADSDVTRLLVFERDVPGRTLDLRTAAPLLELGGMPEWSHDAARLYATYRLPLDANAREFGVLEMPLDGAAPRLQRLLRAGGKDGVMPLALAHDGHALAVVSTYLQTPPLELAADRPPNLAAADLALYLIDLADKGRAVTRIAIPPLEPPRGH